MIVQAMMLQALGAREMFRLMGLPPYDKTATGGERPSQRPWRQITRALRPTYG